MAPVSFEVTGSIAGRWHKRSSSTAIGAAEWADKFHKLGAMPVRIKKDGVVLEDADEFKRLVNAERKAVDTERF